MALAVNSSLPQFSSGNKKYQMRNQKIKELTAQFDAGSIDVEDFLKSMASDQYRMRILNRKKLITHFTLIIILYFKGNVHEYYDSELDSEDGGNDDDEKDDESDHDESDAQSD